jgi:hypothetical protein
LHQTTTRLAREFAVMGVEDLHVRGMMMNQKLARNLRRSALDRASCARINACGEEGSDAGLTASVKPASLKQESAHVLFGHGLSNGLEETQRRRVVRD